MNTQIIEKAEEIIRLLFAKVSKGRALDVTELLEFNKLTKEFDRLKEKVTEEKPEKSPEDILLSYKELESFFNEPEWNSMIEAMREYAESVQSSQSIKVPEKMAECDLLNLYRKTLDVYRTKGSYYVNDKEEIESLCKQIYDKEREYRNTAESKDVYPKEFLIWYEQKVEKVDDRYLIIKEQLPWKIIWENVQLHSLDELFNHWSTVVNRVK